MRPTAKTLQPPLPPALQAKFAQKRHAILKLLSQHVEDASCCQIVVREVMTAAGVEAVVPPDSSTEPADGKPYGP